VRELPVPLESLSSGEWADVEDVIGEQSLVCRLSELGLRAGSRLQIVRPGLLKVGGARLSLRAFRGFQVLVRPISNR
jgi:Fe2+ transport system protein FeoA